MTPWLITRHQRPNGEPWQRLYHRKCRNWINLPDITDERLEAAKASHKCGSVISPWDSAGFEGRRSLAKRQVPVGVGR